MDDLDHSMHIAEGDWSSFYQESEECCLPQPLLAHPEGLRRPHSSVSVTRSPENLEQNITVCVQAELIQDAPGAQGEDEAQCDYTGIHVVKEKVHITEEHIPEETPQNIIKTLEAVDKDVAQSLSTEQEADEGCEDVNKAPLKRERERWFVTLSLNDSPALQRGCASTGGKKTKTKKHDCGTRQEPQSSDSEMNENLNAKQNQNRSKEQLCDVVQNHSERPMHKKDRTQNHEEGKMHVEEMNQDNQEGTWHDNIVQKDEDGSLYENSQMNDHREVTLNGVEMMGHDCKEGTDVTEGTLHECNTMHQENIEGTQFDDDMVENDREGTLYKDNSTKQETLERTQHVDDIVQKNRDGTLPDDRMMENIIEGKRHVENIMEDNNELTLHQHFHLPRMESEEFEDSVEVLTFESSGSETYLSAAESVDFLDGESIENQPKECLSYFSSSSLNSCNPIQWSRANITNTDCPGDQTYVEPKCDLAVIESYVQHEVDPPRVQTGPHLCGNEGPRAVPDVVVTPVVEGPEAHAQASGRTPCVYAISAFWDEMEKLTINDLLQLRMARSPLPNEMSDILSQSSSLVDPEEHHLTDGGLTDASDTADSDYFTQPDESKPDRSSWDFSVCDLEEDYWQFLGMSRNTSPDPIGKTQQVEDEREGSTRSQTPVPVEDYCGQYLRPRSMTKNKSVRNVRALSTGDLPLRSLVHSNDKNSNKELMDSKEEGNLRSTIPAFSHENVLPSFPVSFSTHVPTQSNVICVYDPEGMSSAPEDDMFFTFEHKLLPSQSHRWKPIPIFSCSYPSVTEITIPEWNNVFLRRDFLEEDTIPPFKIVSNALRVAKLPIWKSSLALGKIRFPDKGSIWCKSSDVLPAQGDMGRVSPSVREQQKIVGTMQKPVREGILSALQQADMCLVCIAFASWVLTSSDPESADAWKAALLANVSALSAIQYLRQTK
ncbi:uncharacterized protein perm1 [Corythoichthys intestinalis]|uniref:uncharacterized protein perm1 n=1 Tax=Corythoichthys intestinalis TaxID=161448 RepID=UPI0025A4FCF3|nr:uncharacterized protein perm1 [Corythoichthys intestinalis]